MDWPAWERLLRPVALMSAVGPLLTALCHAAVSGCPAAELHMWLVHSLLLSIEEGVEGSGFHERELSQVFCVPLQRLQGGLRAFGYIPCTSGHITESQENFHVCPNKRFRIRRGKLQNTVFELVKGVF